MTATSQRTTTDQIIYSVLWNNLNIRRHREDKFFWGWLVRSSRSETNFNFDSGSLSSFANGLTDDDCSVRMMANQNF